MLGLITTSATYLFPGGRALKLVKNGVNITNSTNPLTLPKNITLTVLDCCAPPPLRLAAHCIGAGAVINSTSKSEKGAYLGENDSKVNTEVRDPTYWEKEMESKSFSEASKSPLKTTKPSEESSSIPAYQYKDQNQVNFITLSQILEQEKIEIIQLGFQLQAQGTISLKKYYESTQEYSLFQLKGYNIKYETIRRTKLYQNLKA